MNGTLYGVGVGPGDPELITLKAARLIRSAKVIAYPALAGGDSFARAIAAELLTGSAREIRIDIPMTRPREPAQAAYDAGAENIAACLRDGQDVVVLCEGDPLFYGSFMYLNARLGAEFRVDIVPGVTSLTAGAAAMGQHLCARNDVLAVIPGPMDAADMATRIDAADAVAIIKVGRHMAKIRHVLDQLGLMDHATYIERATLADQRLMALSDAPHDAPYFSMILVAKGQDPWL